MKPYTETIPGTEIHFDLAPIPGGTFNMGSPPGEAGRSEDEGPAHRVTVHPFWMGKTEVTWDEYDVFAFKAGITHTVGSPVEETAAEKLADAERHRHREPAQQQHASARRDRGAAGEQRQGRADREQRNAGQCRGDRQALRASAEREGDERDGRTEREGKERRDRRAPG